MKPLGSMIGKKVRDPTSASTAYSTCTYIDGLAVVVVDSITKETTWLNMNEFLNVGDYR